MARPLDPHDLSLTGAGVALVTSPDGSIHSNAVHGLVIDDRRVVSHWQLDTVGATTRRVGWQRTGPSSDRLLYTITTDASFDPIAVLDRRRRVSGTGFDEHLRITAHSAVCRLTIWLTAERDDQLVFHLGDADPDPDDPASTRTLLDSAVDGGRLLEPGGGSHDVIITADGWHPATHGALAIEVDLAIGDTWETHIETRIADERPSEPTRAHGHVTITSVPHELGDAISDARDDLRALTMPVGGRNIVAAGSPFFLALFGRDSMIAGIQFLLDSHRPLSDVLSALAQHQATSSDAMTGAQPGRILHELRTGRAGVFGLPPGSPYYGAADTSPLFVVALGEAARWGAPRDRIIDLLPAAHAALQWCAEHGDIDGDGFIESVPHHTGLTNLGWKDSSDSIIDTHGNVITGNLALCELQGYWYRALRTIAELERWLQLDDGQRHDRLATELAARFAEHFIYDTPTGPYIGLALDPTKHLLDVATSNPGHLLWTGILTPDIADSVATHLVSDDLFSGWGIRTVSAAERGYNPFGYHRGSVWPHDTALAMLGSARIGRHDVVTTLAHGLTALASAYGGQLPELISGLPRPEIKLPVPYTAACRPQAWAAGAVLMATRALLGLEPDIPNGLLHLNPCLDEQATLTIRDLLLGEHTVSFTVTGNRIVDIDAPTLDVRHRATDRQTRSQLVTPPRHT